MIRQQQKLVMSTVLQWYTLPPDSSTTKLYALQEYVVICLSVKCLGLFFVGNTDLGDLCIAFIVSYYHLQIYLLYKHFSCFVSLKNHDHDNVLTSHERLGYLIYFLLHRFLSASHLNLKFLTFPLANQLHCYIHDVHNSNYKPRNLILFTQRNLFFLPLHLNAKENFLTLH